VETITVKLTIAYDGANYAGWQVQKTGVGVQQRIEEAFAKLFPSVRRIHSSSRTDTGVHALGMVAHVGIPRDEFKMPLAKLALALNACLPPDIRVMAAVRCRPDFHARFDATGKQYRYFVWNHSAMNPLWRHQAWHLPRPLDLPAMRGTRNYPMASTVRTLTRCEIKRRGPLLTFILEGDGFLYKMCRSIVGTLAQVGQGKFVAQEIQNMLAGKNRRLTGMTAPAHGLVLWKVSYKPKIRGPRRKLAHAHRPG
jgi:tRNA pseudouridine38-40 synthase